jgi:hypothetical protein
MTHHNDSTSNRRIDVAVLDEFRVRTSTTVGAEFDAELERLVEAAHEHLIDEEYDDEQWGPRMEHELRAALRRMLVMETPAEEIVQTLRIAEFGALSRQHEQTQGQKQEQPACNGTETGETSQDEERDGPGSGSESGSGGLQ